MSSRPSAEPATAPGVFVPARNTRQRSAVRERLQVSGDFQTALQVYDGLRAHGDRIGLTTVYRTLQAMSDAGELDMVRTQDGEAAYRRCSTGHHHHLVCRECGATVELVGPTVERWASAVAKEHDFAEVRHHLEVTGVCASCVAARASEDASG